MSPVALRLARCLCASSLLILAACGGGEGVSLAPSVDAPIDSPSPPEPALERPAAPTGLAVTASTKQYAFRWDLTSGATYYQLLLDPDGDGPLPPEPVDADIAAPDAPSVATQHTPAPELHGRPEARFAVRACNASGCGPASASVAPDMLETLGFLKSDAPVAGERFGTSVALSQDGSTLVVGAMTASPSGTPAGSGRVSVYVRNAGQWALAASLASPTPVTSGAFGNAVAVSADGARIAVGAWGEGTLGSGAVHVFDRQGGNWSLSRSLLASDVSQMVVAMGYRVALSADGLTLAAGTLGAGAVTFTAGDGGWAALPPLAGMGATFLPGASVALAADGQTLAVGDPFNGSGRVYLFSRLADGWDMPVALDGGIPDTTFAFFGNSLALSADGRVLAVGAPGDPLPTGETGAVHVFTRAAGEPWQAGATVRAFNGTAAHLFGFALALSADGRTLVALAPGEASAARMGDQPMDPADTSSADSGALYLLKQSAAGDWTQTAYLKSVRSLNTTRLGYTLGADILSWSAVALSGDGRVLAAGDTAEGSDLTGLQRPPVQGNGNAAQSGAVTLY